MAGGLLGRSDVAAVIEKLPQVARQRGLPTPDREALRAMVAHERKLRDRANVLITENKARRPQPLCCDAVEPALKRPSPASVAGGRTLRNQDFSSLFRTLEELQGIGVDTAAAATKPGAAVAAKGAGVAAAPTTAPGRTTATTAAARKPTGRPGIPIIIVPAAPSALMTMYNIREFLENGRCGRTARGPRPSTRCAGSRGSAAYPARGASRYEEPMAAKQRGVKKETMITIKRKLPSGKEHVYQVTDSFANFKEADWCVHWLRPRSPSARQWHLTRSSVQPQCVVCPARRDRVVAVITQGQEWQFKGFPWPNPTAIFANGTWALARWGRVLLRALNATVAVLEWPADAQCKATSSSLKTSSSTPRSPTGMSPC